PPRRRIRRGHGLRARAMVRPARRVAVRPVRPADTLRQITRARRRPRRVGVLSHARRLDRGHDRCDRGAGRALRARIPRPDHRPERHDSRRHRTAQPHHDRRRHQRRRSAPAAAPLPAGPPLEPVRRAGHEPVPVLRVDAAGRRRTRNERLQRGTGRAPALVPLIAAQTPPGVVDVRRRPFPQASHILMSDVDEKLPRHVAPATRRTTGVFARWKLLLLTGLMFIAAVALLPLLTDTTREQVLTYTELVGALEAGRVSSIEIMTTRDLVRGRYVGSMLPPDAFDFESVYPSQAVDQLAARAESSNVAVTFHSGRRTELYRSGLAVLLQI